MAPSWYAAPLILLFYFALLLIVQQGERVKTFSSAENKTIVSIYVSHPTILIITDE